MCADIASLYKILKDNTNQKILVLINEAGSLSYADLIGKSEILGETLLNYHLKVLGDLLNKNSENQYVLTEKGQYALKILKEKPEQLKKFKRKKQKQNAYALGLGCVISLIIALFCYFRGYIDVGIVRRIVIAISMIVIFYVGQMMRAAALVSESAKRKYTIAAKISGMIFGGLVGIMIALIVNLIATIISVSVGGPNFLQDTSSNTAFIFSYLSCFVVIGCIAGYYIGKKLAKKITLDTQY